MVSKIVCPSANDLAAWATPIVDPPPARFSTTTGLPSCEESFWPMALAVTSVLPPATKGTIIVMGLLG